MQRTIYWSIFVIWNIQDGTHLVLLLLQLTIIVTWDHFLLFGSFKNFCIHSYHVLKSTLGLWKWRSNFNGKFISKQGSQYKQFIFLFTNSVSQDTLESSHINRRVVCTSIKKFLILRCLVFVMLYQPQHFRIQVCHLFFTSFDEVVQVNDGSFYREWQLFLVRHIYLKLMENAWLGIFYVVKVDLFR